MAGTMTQALDLNPTLSEVPHYSPLLHLIMMQKFRCLSSSLLAQTSLVPASLEVQTAPRSIYLNSFRRDIFLSESFFMTFATAISKSSCIWTAI